ncbi:hypothetical protein Peur_057343 [Populus x canadensis]
MSRLLIKLPSGAANAGLSLRDKKLTCAVDPPILEFTKTQTNDRWKDCWVSLPRRKKTSQSLIKETSKYSKFRTSKRLPSFLFSELVLALFSARKR